MQKEPDDTLVLREEASWSNGGTPMCLGSTMPAEAQKENAAAGALFNHVFEHGQCLALGFFVDFKPYFQAGDQLLHII